MKKIFVSVVAILVSGLAVQAQQQGLYSNFLLNSYVFNPAIAGVEDHMDLKTSFRRQWLDLPGSPTTMYASLHCAVNPNDLVSDW